MAKRRKITALIAGLIVVEALVAYKITQNPNPPAISLFIVFLEFSGFGAIITWAFQQK